LKEKWTTMVDELTLNFTIILHGTTQTRFMILPKATATPHNPQQRLLSSLGAWSGVKWVSQPKSQSYMYYDQALQDTTKRYTNIHSFLLSK